MDKGMDSFKETNNSTGNSAMLGLSSRKPTLQPIRIKQFLDMCGSDEEDSEDKEKDSSESESDDVQPLPEDSEEKAEGHDTVFEENLDCMLETITESNDEVGDPLSRHFSHNFSINKPQKRESNIQEGTNCCSEPKAFPHSEENHLTRLSSNRRSNVKLEAPWQLGDNCGVSGMHRRESNIERASSLCSESENLLHSQENPPERLSSNRRSNVKLEVPVTSTGPPLLSTNVETPNYSSSMHENRHLDSKFEIRESTYQSRETHASSALESHLPVSSSLPAPLVHGPHYVTDTPMKNNPPIGSMRPTPSTSHRNIFQTPQSKLQDYGKSHVQTPATIFANWSSTHMAHTPLQNHPTSGETVSRSSVVSQPLASHDIPLYRPNVEKKVRRPLSESLQPLQSNQRGQMDKLLSQNYEYQNHFRDNLPEKSSVSFVQESKENWHPQNIEKRIMKEAIPREKIMENKFMESREKSEIDVPGYEEDFLKSRDSKPMIPREMEIKRDFLEGKRNVQASIPSHRKQNYGETITVKDKEYLVLGILGAGMSGQVLRVQDTATLDLKAIKVVDLSRMDKDCAQGCLQEISMLRKLQAPCIVKMFDYEIKSPIVSVVMEAGDTDFKNLLLSMSEKKQIPFTMILYYWTEMLTAVKHIHDNGVIHSDLKPANFLLVRGRLKLIDFGIASTLNTDMTSVVKSNSIGTLSYISPEALMDINGGSNGDSPSRTKFKISFKSDVWSLGCILYSLVYGYTPFQYVRGTWQKINAIINPEPKISFSVPPDSDIEPPPPILIDVMKKCLQHDPKARPTVTQLLQIPYIPLKQSTINPEPSIPPTILMKIKYSLSDSEWRQFLEIMEGRRNQ